MTIMNLFTFTNRTKKPRMYMRGCVMVLAALLCTASVAHADPTQEEVFKSISNSVDGKTDGGKVLAVVSCIIGAFGLMVWLSKREKRVTTPRALNHQGRLMREIIKTAGLKPSEARRLKALAEELGDKGEPLESPITLMLCPSLMKKARGVEEVAR